MEFTVEFYYQTYEWIYLYMDKMGNKNYMIFISLYYGIKLENELVLMMEFDFYFMVEDMDKIGIFCKEEKNCMVM